MKRYTTATGLAVASGLFRGPDLTIRVLVMSFKAEPLVVKPYLIKQSRSKAGHQLQFGLFGFSQRLVRTPACLAYWRQFDLVGQFGLNRLRRLVLAFFRFWPGATGERANYPLGKSHLMPDLFFEDSFLDTAERLQPFQFVRQVKRQFAQPVLFLIPFRVCGILLAHTLEPRYF